MLRVVNFGLKLPPSTFSTLNNLNILNILNNQGTMFRFKPFLPLF